MINSDKPQCQICLKKGHTAAKCYHQFDLSFTGSTLLVSQSPSQFSIPQPHQALLAAPTTSPSTVWFLDSETTTHVIADINNLSSFALYTGIGEVHMGNGSGL
jgi:hypothetical protein